MIIIPAAGDTAISYGYNILYPQLFKTLIQNNILKYRWINSKDCYLTDEYNEIVNKDFTSNAFLNIKSLYNSLITQGMIFPFLNENEMVVFRGGHRLKALQVFNNQDKWLCFYPNPELKDINIENIYIPQYTNDFTRIKLVETTDIKSIIYHAYRFSDMTGGGARLKNIKLVPHSYFNDPQSFEEFLTF